MLLTLATAPWVSNLLILLLLGVAVLLVLTVLIQRPQGGGLSAAFGSAGSGQTAFGTKTGDALTVFTVIMFAAFVLAAIALNYVMRPPEGPAGTVIEGTLDGAAPATTTPPAPSDSGLELVPVTPPQEVPPVTPEPTPAPADQPAPEQPAPDRPPASTPPEQPAPAEQPSSGPKR
ncbi:MAG: hypothetical protein GIKADHBN_02295 [Phycisphaerales bacterium]|nr:hypothetical protein [Phycisphaerales bacterium]